MKFAKKQQSFYKTLKNIILMIILNKNIRKNYIKY